MEGEVLIKVENVSKKFSKDLKKSLKYGYQDLRTLVFGKGKKRELRESEFWAVKDVSFEVRRGECLGLIGHNGAGKSTLLKVLNGLINPDEGRVEMRGRVGALIELGAGFNAILTGRENIYNSAAVYGFSKEETDAKIDDIIAFSELEDFLDMPVQNYSSGMKVRLGFAVAASMEPDILLIDEVLAVGDVGFRIKCLNRIQELLEKCAVIYVSHSMPQVGKICTKAILMNSGKSIINTIDVSKAIQMYFDYFETEAAADFGNGKGVLNNFEVIGGEKEDDTYLFEKGTTIHFNADISIDKEYSKVYCAYVFHDLDLRTVARGSSFEQGANITNNRSNIKINVSFPNLFTSGKYSVTLNIYELKGENYDMQGEIILAKRNFIKLYSYGHKQADFTPIQIPGEWDIN